ncbi:MAG TPA: hypothetical protein VGQ51_06850 [Puia sp.]|nr:hypothetical protein [Puia sp.]
MKRHIRLLSSVTAIIVLSAAMIPTAANAQEAKKQRLINKSYDVTSNDRLIIENQFGNVVVSTWDKPQITVDIEIGARAASDSKAQDIMDKINVRDSRNGREIHFKTDVDEIHNSNKMKGDKGRDNENGRGFYIDYVVHMPASNGLKIDNSFGKTEVPALTGPVTLISKFGSLNAGRLNNVDTVDVEFGKADIDAINNGKVIVKFDKNAHIGKVEGNAKISCEFSQNVEVRLTNNIQELSLSESYSGVRLIVDKDLSADFEVHSSFGRFHNESDFNIDEKSEEGESGPRFDRDYAGKAGSGKARIRIKSSFGSVRLSHEGGKDRDDG